VNKRAEFENLFSILVLYRYYMFSFVKTVCSGDGGKLSQRETQYTLGKTKYWGTKQQVNLIDREADPRGLKLEAEDGR
jgi:hypothetical protein